MSLPPVTTDHPAKSAREKEEEFLRKLGLVQQSEPRYERVFQLMRLAFPEFDYSVSEAERQLPDGTKISRKHVSFTNWPNNGRGRHLTKAQCVALAIEQLRNKATVWMEGGRLIVLPLDLPHAK